MEDKMVVWVIQGASVYWDWQDRPITTWPVLVDRGFFHSLEQAQQACQSENEKPLAIVQAD